MRSLSEIQFWFVAAGVALTPMLTLWIADGIGWFLRRTLWSRPDVSQCREGRPAFHGEAAGPGVDRSGARQPRSVSAAITR